MPRWVLGCPECNRDFTHTEIPADPKRRSFDRFLGTEAKPEFPQGGLRIECPNCKKTSIFQRYQLVYRH
jgi:hypothetical protein